MSLLEDSGTRILAVLAFVVALVVNGLANWLPLGGRTTGELSGMFPNLFVPAGGTFSIWGVIYLLVGAWAVVQFFPSAEATGRRIAPLFTLSSLLNAGWLFAWHQVRVGLSVVIMFALLWVLLRVNLLLRETRGGQIPGTLPRVAFGIYFGWILVAALVNVTVLLVAAGWDGDLGLVAISDAAWAIMLVVLGAGAACFAIVGLRNSWVGLSVVWAFGGIAVNRWDDFPAIAWTAVAMMLVVGATTGWGFLRGDRWA